MKKQTNANGGAKNARSQGKSKNCGKQNPENCGK